MSASNDKLLYKAARDGDLAKVKNLPFKGVGTDYRNEVSYLIVYNYESCVINILF